jgi:hypothetical protein
MIRGWTLIVLLGTALSGCGGDPRLSVKNTYSATVFYEITMAGEPSAYLAGNMVGREEKRLTLQVGKNLMFFVQPDTTGNQQNFITFDSLLAEKGEKYLLELNPQYVSGHLHDSPRTIASKGVEIQSCRKPLR